MEKLAIRNNSKTQIGNAGFRNNTLQAQMFQPGVASPSKKRFISIA